jgi:hypothetical protein
MLDSIHLQLLHIISGMSIGQIALAYLGASGFICFLAARKLR